MSIEQMRNEQQCLLYRELKGLAEGKIECSCGNADWHDFLYIKAGETYYGGCKKCGNAHTLIENLWLEIGKKGDALI